MFELKELAQRFLELIIVYVDIALLSCCTHCASSCLWILVLVRKKLHEVMLVVKRSEILKGDLRSTPNPRYTLSVWISANNLYIVIDQLTRQFMHLSRPWLVPVLYVLGFLREFLYQVILFYPFYT